MNVKLIAGALALTAAFIAGWVAQGWRMDAKLTNVENKQLSEQVSGLDESLSKLDNKLGDVVVKAGEAAQQTQNTLNNIHQIRTNTNAYNETVSRQTQELQDEIAKLVPTSCMFDPATGGLWLRASDKANAGRNALYGTQSRSRN